MARDDLGIDVDEEVLESWERYLDDFEEKLFPLFQKRGFTFEQAFVAWMLNATKNAIIQSGDDDGDWKGT